MTHMRVSSTRRNWFQKGKHMGCEIVVYLSGESLWKSDDRSIMLPFLREQTM